MDKSRWFSVMALLTIVIGVTLPTTAQPRIKWRGSDGWGVSSRYEQQFNNYSLQTFSGKITQIDTVTPMVDMATGIQVTIKSDREEIPVILGPAWYILYQDMNLTLNDQVDVRGNRISMNSKSYVMAAEVKRKERVLQLRDQDGVPYWCAWRRK